MRPNSAFMFQLCVRPWGATTAYFVHLTYCTQWTLFASLLRFTSLTCRSWSVLLHLPYSSSALIFTCIFLLGLVPTLLLSCWAQRRCYAAQRCVSFVHMALRPTACSAPAATCILLKPQGFLPRCGFPCYLLSCCFVSFCRCLSLAS